MWKKRIASVALAGTMLGTAGAGVVQAHPNDTVQVGGASGVVAAVLNADVTANNNVVEVDVIELNNSINNLRALNNVLNNNDIDVTVGDVSILRNFLNGTDIEVENFLDDKEVDIDDVVAIGILDGGDVIVFV